MCLQVVIAAIYYNPTLLLETMEKMHLPNSTESITAQFLKQWLHDTDCFLGLHDRKLAVLGLTALLNTPNNRPQAINFCADQVLEEAAEDKPYIAAIMMHVLELALVFIVTLRV